MRKRWRLLIVIGSLLLHQGARAQSLTVVTPDRQVTFERAALEQKLATHVVAIDDPLYRKSKAFDAFALADIFALAGIAADTKADEVVFTAEDGYAPNIAFAKLAQHHPYIAYQDHGTPGRFAMVAHAKSSISPGPFYLVWDEGAKLETAVPWPYQLIKIELVDWARKYPLVAPRNVKSDSPEAKGFVVFKERCISCHSINLQGGEVGPELNVPKNVTEYWKPEVLKALIHKASAFRAKSKMPDFTQLSESNIDDVVAYLTLMKTAKIQP